MYVYTRTYRLHNVHNSTVVGREGGGVVYWVCHIIFLVFSNFHIQKGVQVKIGLKLKIRIMSSVTMIKHSIISKRCLVIFNISCLKRLKLSTQYASQFPVVTILLVESRFKADYRFIHVWLSALSVSFNYENV